LLQADKAQQQCRQTQMYGCDGTMNVLEVLDLLNRNLKKEYTLGIMLGCVCWARVLTGYQFAKAAFHSYPYFPDTHSMMAVMYDDYSHLGGVEIFGGSTGVGAAGGTTVGVRGSTAVQPAAAKAGPRSRGKRNSNNSSSSPTYGSNIVGSPPPIAVGVAPVVNGAVVGSLVGGGNGMVGGGSAFYVNMTQPPQQQQPYFGQLQQQQQYLPSQGYQQPQQYSGLSVQQYSQMLPPFSKQQQYGQPMQQQYGQPQQQYGQPQQQYGQPVPQQLGLQLSGDAGSGSFASAHSFNSSGSFNNGSIPNGWHQQQPQQQGLAGTAAAFASDGMSGGYNAPAGVGGGVVGEMGFEVQQQSVAAPVGHSSGGMLRGGGDAGAVQGVYEQWVSGL
jgi:hypothetical protein